MQSNRNFPSTILCLLVFSVIQLLNVVYSTDTAAVPLEIPVSDRSIIMSFIIRDEDVNFDDVASAFNLTYGNTSITASPVNHLSWMLAKELELMFGFGFIEPSSPVKSQTSPSGILYYEVHLSVGPQCTGALVDDDSDMIATYNSIKSLKKALLSGAHNEHDFVALSAIHVPSGFSVTGSSCTLPSDKTPSGWAGNGKHVDNPTVTATTFQNDPGKITVTWDDAKGGIDLFAMATADIGLIHVTRGTGNPTRPTIVVQTVNASDLAFTFEADSYRIIPGTYIATVTLGKMIKGQSSAFLVASKCSALCSEHGICDPATGACSCDTGYAGRDCSATLCEAKACRKETAASCAVHFGVAVCQCTGGWTGELCDESPCNACDENNTKACDERGNATCECNVDTDGSPLAYGKFCEIPWNHCDVVAPCDHHGSRTGEFDPVTGKMACTSCVCEGNWSASSDCRECALDCAHGMSVIEDGTCSQCQCPYNGGLGGNRCHCRHAYMTFIIRDADFSLVEAAATYDAIHGENPFFSDEEKLGHLFSSELASLTSIPSVLLTETPMIKTSPLGTQYYAIRVSVAPPCNNSGVDTDANMQEIYDAASDLKTTLAGGLHILTNFTVLPAIHLPSGFRFHDPNCELEGDDYPTSWAGRGKLVDCEPNADSCQKSSGKSLPLGIIVGIPFIVALLVITIILYSAKLGCFAEKVADEE